MSSIKHRVNRIEQIGEEITTLKEVEGLFSIKSALGQRPICYDGFEPSGKIHIAQGLMKAHYIKTMVDCGCDVIIWIADVFALLNNKMGGDPNKIKVCGEYMVQVWTFYLTHLNVDMSRVKFLWASEQIAKDPTRYWKIVMHIATKFNIARFKKCTPILGRNEVQKHVTKLTVVAEQFEKEGKFKEACNVYKEIVSAEEKLSMPLSYLMYAAMQCADIYYLKADICQLGVDQKKVNMLAREYASIVYNEKPSFIEDRPPPIIVSHHMLMGLQQSMNEDGSVELVKMSKSNPDSAIFMDDSVTDVNRKIKKAFCRPSDITNNPILEYIKYIILPLNKSITIKKPEKFGGETFTFNQYEYSKLEELFKQNVIHPADIKPVVRNYINKLLEPMREHFKTNKQAKQILRSIKNWKSKIK